ncbi:hypothetical protein ScPMuIL_000801 [Solemya velum]
MEKKVTEVKVIDVDKRRIPSKHYVYIISVAWEDGTNYIIYRRYSRFFDLQCKLGDMFPLEAGHLNPLDRIIPLLPGKILFGRSQIREVALKRLAQLDEYLEGLIRLPTKISACEEVLGFFEVEPDDISPPKQPVSKKKSATKAKNISGPKLMEHYVAVGAYQKQEKGELDLNNGDVVEVLEKNHSGWWFVTVDDHQGWVPSTYLQPEDGPQENVQMRAEPGEEERYVCTESYEPAGEDEVRLEKGSIVDVVEKNLEGWWLIRYKGQEGWAPATYLMEASLLYTQNKAKQSGVEVVGNLKDISDLLNPGDNKRNYRVDLDSALLNQQIKKFKNSSLQRNGSTRPPPRQNTIKNRGRGKSNSSIKKTYQTLADFEDNVGDGISFKAGQALTVLEKTEGGWWFVKIGEKEGWAPSTYIGELGSGPAAVEVEYNQLTSSEESSSSEGDWGSDADIQNADEQENVYSEIYHGSPPVSPKLPSKLSPLTKPHSVSTERINLPPPPKVPENKHVATAGSEDKPESLTGALKARFEQNRSLPPPPPSSKKKPSQFPSQENRSVSELQSVSKPLTPPLHKKPSQFTSQENRSVSELQSVSKPLTPPLHKKPLQVASQKDSPSAEPVLLSVSVSKPSPPSPSQKKAPQVINQLDSNEPQSTAFSKPPPPPNKSKPPTQLIKQPVTSKKPPPPANTSKPLWKTKNTSFDSESDNRKSIDMPITGTTSALKSRFEGKQQPPIESTVPHKMKPHTASKDNSITNALKAKLENRLQNVESGHSESDFKLKKEVPAKPFTPKKATPLQADKPHQFTPKPSVTTTPDSSLKYNSKSVEKSRDRELPRENTTSSLKSKFEAGFGKAGKSSDSPRPVSGNAPKPFQEKKFGHNAPLDRNNSEESSDTPQRNSAAALRAMFEKSKDKTNPNVAQKKPTFGQKAVKPKVTDQNASRPVVTSKPNLPQKKQTVSSSQQKENEKNSQNVSNIASVLKSKLNFGVGLAPSEKKGTIETPKASVQHAEVESSPRLPSETSEVILPSETSEVYTTVADFTAEEPDGISFIAGTRVEVLEKNEGWWWIRVGGAEGWAPETYLEPAQSRNGQNSSNPIYKAICNFAGENEGEISLREGEELEVLEKVDQWWFVRTDVGDGWAPESYIEQA